MSNEYLRVLRLFEITHWFIVVKKNNRTEFNQSLKCDNFFFCLIIVFFLTDCVKWICVEKRANQRHQRTKQITKSNKKKKKCRRDSQKKFAVKIHKNDCNYWYEVCANIVQSFILSCVATRELKSKERKMEEYRIIHKRPVLEKMMTQCERLI